MSLKPRAAKRLRRWADKLDPPKPAETQRHHPALKDPGVLADVPSEASVGQVAEKPGQYLYSDAVLGRWGGPYL